MKKVILIAVSLILATSHVLAFRFLVNADTHVGDDTHANYILKSEQKIQMIEYCRTHHNVETVLLCGDMTENGYSSQFTAFSKEWLDPFGELDIPVRMAYGNHDTYVKHWYSKKAVLDYIKKVEGDLHYSFDIEGTHFICCGNYPDGSGTGSPCCPLCWDTMTWMRDDLEEVGTQIPVVIFFHYNLVGPFSDWWTEENKDTFYDIIKDYNIQCVFTGHLHGTFTHQWRDTIPSACVGGDYFAIGKCNEESFTVRFMDKDGNVKKWEELLNDDYQEELRSSPTTNDPQGQVELIIDKLNNLENQIHLLRMEQKQLELEYTQILKNKESLVVAG